MKLLLALAIAAFAAEGATHKALLALAIERWTPMARPETADPELKKLALQLQELRRKTLAAQAEDPGLPNLQQEFDSWKDAFKRAQFARRPQNASNDLSEYGTHLEREVGVLAGGAGEAAAKRLDTLKALVDPMAFSWYLERSRQSGRTVASFAGGYGAMGGASGGYGYDQKPPKGWTWGAPGKTALTDLDRPAPADPVLAAEVTAWGEFKKKVGGTVGWCYAGVKKILAQIGVVDSFIGNKGVDEEGKIVREGEVMGAYQFNRWVQNHPSLQNRHLTRALPAWPLAVSDIVVWGRGTCGYNTEWGHIEMIYKLSPDAKQAWAVSDHSSEFRVSCFKEQAAKVSAANDAFHGLKDKADNAGLDAIAAAHGGNRKMRRAADKALAAAKTELRKAQTLLDSLAVYKVGPEK